MPGLFDSSIYVTQINRTSETLLLERKNPFVCYRFGEVTLAGVPSPLHLLVSKTGFLLSILFTTDVSIHVNKGMRMIATLAELGCFACDLGEGRTTVMAVLTSSRRHDMTGIILKKKTP